MVPGDIPGPGGPTPLLRASSPLHSLQASNIHCGGALLSTRVMTLATPSSRSTLIWCFRQPARPWGATNTQI